jgi:glycosyltransferase involved in cell wall biosynthesis
LPVEVRRVRILYLATWFPYPLSQGAKIRSYYLLQALAERHEVGLISFEDEPIQPEWLAHLGSLCSRVEVVRINPFRAGGSQSIREWISARPRIALTSYSSEMMAAVQRCTLEWKPDRIIAQTFITAPYALQPGIPAILDVDNVMSGMLYEELLIAPSPILKARRWLAWLKMRNYESGLYRRFDRCLLISERDEAKIRTFIPFNGGQTEVIPNGVDIMRNLPGLAQPQPATLIYSGAMTYGANYDAVRYFLDAILPIIAEHIPNVTVRISGKYQGVDLAGLKLNQRVILTGFVEDIRPVISSSWGAIVPLRIGGGSRLKILEAMALGTPVISTPKGVEGIDAIPDRHILIGSDADEFARQTVRLINDPNLRRTLAENAAKFVRSRYNWAKIGEKFVQKIEARGPVRT